MKKLFIGLFLFFAAVFPVFATESIDSYVVDAVIGKDASVRIVETISYDFGSESRHGIFRYIPITKTNTENKKFALDVKDLTVTDETQVPYTFKPTTDNDKLTLKIGDPDSTITGKHVYVISYSVGGSLTYFSDHDEFYWNVIGTGWDVPITSGSARITLPDTISGDQVQVACFTGPVGSTDADCRSVYQDGVVTVTATRPIGGSEGMSVVIGFPKGVVAQVEPKEIVPFFETLWGKIVFALIVVVALFWYVLTPFGIIWYWWRFGRDPKPPMGVTSAWFSPPKNSKRRALSPVETGALVDETVDMRDIFGTMIDLARRGYIKIKETEKNKFSFIKMKPWDDELLESEKELLNGLFGAKETVKLSDINLLSTVQKVSGLVYSSLVADGFFPKNPQSIRTVLYAIGGVAMVTFNLLLALVAFIVGKHIPRKTLMGAQEAAVGMSLKNFLSSQERHVTFQAKNQMFFEKLLPYAIAFGVEKEWAKRFATIKMTPPDWYEPYHSGSFNSAVFARSLGAGYTSGFAASSSYKSSSGFSSGFSGGGSSGGGGGGGGGGSW